MRRCPSARALVRLFAGAGRAAHEAHLAQCRGCAERYRRLADDVARVGFVLERTAAAGATRVPHAQMAARTAQRDGRPPRVGARGWAWGVGAAAVTVAAALVLVAGERPGDPHTSRVGLRSAPRPRDAVHAAVGDVSSALFQLGAAEPAYQLPRPRSPSSYVQAALEGGGPCRRVGSAVACE